MLPRSAFGVLVCHVVVICGSNNMRLILQGVLIEHITHRSFISNQFYYECILPASCENATFSLICNQGWDSPPSLVLSPLGAFISQNRLLEHLTPIHICQASPPLSCADKCPMWTCTHKYSFNENRGQYRAETVAHDDVITWKRYPHHWPLVELWCFLCCYYSE